MFYVFDLWILHTIAYDVLVERYSFEQNNLHIGESPSCHNKKNFSLIEWEGDCEKLRTLGHDYINFNDENFGNSSFQV